MGRYFKDAETRYAVLFLLKRGLARPSELARVYGVSTQLLGVWVRDEGLKGAVDKARRMELLKCKRLAQKEVDRVKKRNEINKSYVRK